MSLVTSSETSVAPVMSTQSLAIDRDATARELVHWNHWNPYSGMGNPLQVPGIASTTPPERGEPSSASVRGSGVAAIARW